MVFHPVEVFWLWLTLLAKSINAFVSSNRKNPSRNACAGWIKQMRFVPYGCHNILSAFFGHSGIRAGSHKKRFYAGRKMIEEFFKTVNVLGVAY
jgi:hypothetical protein